MIKFTLITEETQRLYDLQVPLMNRYISNMKALSNAAEVLSTLGMDITSIVEAEKHIQLRYEAGKSW